jgi:putative lipoic acid-binding regulatory protein
VSASGLDDSRIPIEELVEFPTRFLFKAVGHHTLQFSGDALKAVQRALGDDRKVELRTRLSAKAAYVSATLTTVVESADELKAAYEALRKVPGVITVL